MIHVVAIITAKPGQRATVLEHVRRKPAEGARRGRLHRIRRRDRHRRHGPIQTPFGPDTFVVIEKWESVDHLKAHAVAPHMKEYGAKTKELLAGRVIHVLKPV